MKTTLEIPDDLMRAIRMRAAREERTLKDVTTELLRRGLNTPPAPQSPPSRFPVIECRACKDSSKEALSPDEVHRILLEGETSALTR